MSTKIRSLSKFSVATVLAVVVAGFHTVAWAEPLSCSDAFGECTLDASSVSCECVSGEGMDGDGEGMEVSEAKCQEWLEQFCGGAARCATDKGECRVYGDDYYGCTCADGEDIDGSLDEPSEGDATCSALLAELCPDDPPDPAEVCPSDSLSLCEDLADKLNACQGVSQLAYVIIDCCEDYSGDSEAIAATEACLAESDCDAFLACWDDVPFDDRNPATGDGDDLADGDDGSDDDGDGSAAEEDADNTEADDEGDGCRQSSSVGAWFVMLLFVAVMVRRRRLLNR